MCCAAAVLQEMNGYKASHLHKWVVLDGDIDATWIESMNTVMDDNKAQTRRPSGEPAPNRQSAIMCCAWQVLTLVSNERIPFTQTMRMLLEIQAPLCRSAALRCERPQSQSQKLHQDMKHASPATVSRGGVLYINEQAGKKEGIFSAFGIKIPELAESSDF